MQKIFGPIAAIQRFSSEAEVISRANATEFGLAGYVFTENLDRALNVADRCRRESSASTKVSRQTPPRPSAASSSPASAVKEAPKASKSTKTSASTTWPAAPRPKTSPPGNHHPRKSKKTCVSQSSKKSNPRKPASA